MSAVCESEKGASSLARVPRLRVLDDAALLEDHCAQAVIAHVPEKCPGGMPEKYLRELLTQALRVVGREGMILLVALRGQAENALSRLPGLEAEARYDIVISGKKTVVWILRAETAEEN